MTTFNLREIADIFAGNSKVAFGISKAKVAILLRELAERLESGKLAISKIEVRDRVLNQDFAETEFVITVHDTPGAPKEGEESGVPASTAQPE